MRTLAHTPLKNRSRNKFLLTAGDSVSAVGHFQTGQKWNDRVERRRKYLVQRC